MNFTFKDGSSEEVRIPAEIWRKNDKNVSKIFFFKKEVASIEMDPWLETADINLNDNHWPRKTQLSKWVPNALCPTWAPLQEAEK